VNKRLKDIEFLGAVSHSSSDVFTSRVKTSQFPQFHASDLVQTILGHAELQDYLINFINHLDPNGASNASLLNETLINWPRFSTDTRELLTILDGSVPLTITKDDFRQEPIQFLMDVSLELPL
jgi:acetylcholinesterase